MRYFHAGFNKDNSFARVNFRQINAQNMPSGVIFAGGGAIKLYISAAFSIDSEKGPYRLSFSSDRWFTSASALSRMLAIKYYVFIFWESAQTVDCITNHCEYSAIFLIGITFCKFLQLFFPFGIHYDFEHQCPEDGKQRG
ncbi:MAG: hypothetical protein IKV10_00850 [Alphaproteobacteria bacterium]|nr:hypothetical protein [Alphaproteobacteria bacterium]